MPRGRFYLGRISKAGVLDDEMLIEALVNPAAVTAGAHAWTFSNVRVFDGAERFVYGRLAKFQPTGEVRVLEGRREVPAIEENLLVASSPFVYIPDQAAIAHLHIWNQIERNTFRRRFKEIVEETFDNFFVECHIEPISDLQSFFRRMARLERISRLSAKVVPPNPLYGPLWRRIVEYLERRNASELVVRESSDDDGLRTEVVRVAETVAEEGVDNLGEEVALDLTDAAILMAVDGYGSAKVEGVVGGRTMTVRTQESAQSFVFDSDPGAEQLFDEAMTQLRGIVQRRGLRHDEEG